MSTRLCTFLAALSVTAFSAPAFAVDCITTSPPGSIPAAQLVVLSTAATATSTFCGGTAGYSSDAWLEDGATDVYLGTGNVTSSGYTVDLGAFTAGEELIFYIYVRNTGYTYYTGPGERNPDGIVHAAVTDLGDGQFHIGFEDLDGGGDMDYDDINIVIQTTGIVIDTDQDDDGIDDVDDNCMTTWNPDQADADGDGAGDVCDDCPYDLDNDADGDDVCGDVDNCDVYNPDQADADGDGAGDLCDDCPLDPDDDADGDDVCGDVDNCDVYNPDQADADGDGAGDLCDDCPYDDADDADDDGVCGDEDLCADTVLPEGVPTLSLGVNRFADVDGDGVFDTTLPRGKGPMRSYDLFDTAGCSCEQIIDELELGLGHVKFGCSISAMDEWTWMVSAY